MDKIDFLHAHEILDSRGNPTLYVSVTSKKGVTGWACVPSGKSTGTHEAVELRDGDKKRYGGYGVRKAAHHVNVTLQKVLRGYVLDDVRAIDDAIRVHDGTVNKRRLGANTLLGVSLAVAHAGAKSNHVPLYIHLRNIFGIQEKRFVIPTPLCNIMNGGRHADTRLGMQEFIIAPVMKKSFAEKIRAGSEIFHNLGDILHKERQSTNVGDEGGYAPDIDSAEEALQYLAKATKDSGYVLGRDIQFGVDVAASEFYDERGDRYVPMHEGRRYTAKQMTERYRSWCKKFPMLSIEDGLAEDDWEGWQFMTKELKNDVLLIGDDLFVTQIPRFTVGVEKRVGNAILIKPNQVGTLSETMDVITLAKKHKYTVVISHRSGETIDTSIADIAVATNAGYIKAGAPSRSERLAKYNRLLEIEEELR